jgi:hypothetical protein
VESGFLLLEGLVELVDDGEELFVLLLVFGCICELGIDVLFLPEQ